MDKQELLKKAEKIKKDLGIALYVTSLSGQTHTMRLIDDYADAIHAYRLAELVERMQGGS